MNDKELKPCPFCGGVPRLREYRTFDEQIHGVVTRYYVQCEACGIEVPALGYGSGNKATEAWNRRAKDPKKILKKLPAARQEPPWIPCDKKLPDYGYEVLVSLYDTTEVAHRVAAAVPGLEEDGWMSPYGYGISSEEVYAWMPFPQPYEGGGE